MQEDRVFCKCGQLFANKRLLHNHMIHCPIIDLEIIYKEKPELWWFRWLVFWIEFDLNRIHRAYLYFYVVKKVGWEEWRRNEYFTKLLGMKDGEK